MRNAQQGAAPDRYSAALHSGRRAWSLGAMRKTILAAVISPVAVAPAVAICNVVSGFILEQRLNLTDWYVYTLYGIPIALVIVIVYGVPVHLALTRRGVRTIWAYAILGFTFPVVII